MNREYPDRPIVGIGVVIIAEDRVLLVRRAKPPLGGEWSLPGGAQHLGETAAEAAVREVREETGLEIDIGGLLDTVDFIDRDEDDRVRRHYTLIDFWAEAPKAADLVPGDDAADAAWFREDQAVAKVNWSETRRIIGAAFERVRRGTP